MNEQLRERIGELIESGKGQSVADTVFIPLLTLDSGSVIGLDKEAHWVATSPDGTSVHPFGPGEEKWFYEAAENPRSDFEEQLGQGAKQAGLEADPVVFSFPSVDLVREVLGINSQYFARLGLLWLLPSELRPLRKEIVAVAENDKYPRQVRELAQRLVVPE